MHVFQNQNFILLLFGRIITNFGDSLYGVASMLLVYEMTKSTFFTGLATFSVALPTAFQVLFGPFVDRFNQRMILVLSEWIPAVLIFIIPTMYYFDLLNIWMLLFIMAVTSFIWTIVYPTQQAVMVKNRRSWKHYSSQFYYEFHESRTRVYFHRDFRIIHYSLWIAQYLLGTGGGFRHFRVLILVS